MNAKEQLIREIEQAPDAVVAEVLDFFLFVKQREQQKHQHSSPAQILEEIAALPLEGKSDGAFH
ncbi:hypothetical protein C7B76_10815 [filamentous cyanobacterium CCP2]|nr:hypothetical protein C7B76_10815 [filamentous cyanobacterium CCP2]